MKTSTTMEMSFGTGPFLKEFINHSEIINAMIIPMSGASKIKLAVLTTTSEFTDSKPALSNSSSGKSTYQCMGRRRRYAKPPGKQVPEYSGD